MHSPSTTTNDRKSHGIWGGSGQAASTVAVTAGEARSGQAWRMAQVALPWQVSPVVCKTGIWARINNYIPETEPNSPVSGSILDTGL